LNVIGEELDMLKMLDDDDASFGSKFSSQMGSELELSTNSHLNIPVKEFNIFDYNEIV
jgi:hypothetical protein